MSDQSVTTEPVWPRRSNDGVEFGPEGKTFEITRTVDGEESITPFTLHDLLPGLNLKPGPSGKSQAETFASLALSRGFSDEAQVMERYRDVSVRQNNQTKQYFSTSWRLIDVWIGENEDERNRKAAATMTEKAVPISTGQRIEAKRLLPLLAEAEGAKIRSQLLDLIQADEDEDGPLGGRMTRTIGRAHQFLSLMNPQARQSTTVRPNQPGEMVGEQVVEESVTDTTSEGGEQQQDGSQPDPF